MHYVISDLHAHTELYYKFKESLSADDKVFILGDVIDKGDGTLDILLDTMKDCNAELLLGNHELMMWEYLTACKTGNEAAMNKFGKRCMILNGGTDTFAHYEKLDKYTQDMLYGYLSSKYLQYRVCVNNRNFILTHSVPHGDDTVLFQDHCKILSGYENQADKWVWDRVPYCYVDDCIVITGHNIVQYNFYSVRDYANGNRDFVVETDGVYHNENDIWVCDKEGSWYDIDMGLAMNNEYSKLAILRLEDMSIRYIK